MTASHFTITTTEFPATKDQDRRIRVTGGGLVHVQDYDLDKGEQTNHINAAAVVGRRLGVRSGQATEVTYVHNRGKAQRRGLVVTVKR